MEFWLIDLWSIAGSLQYSSYYNLIIFMQGEGMAALVYGGTGAIGAELVAALLASPKWTRVHCVVRHQLAQWSKLPGKEKLTVEVNNDFDNYFKAEHKNYENFSSLFCCLGSRAKDQTLVKVQKNYPLHAADIALINKIPHYLYVSSMGSNPKSWFQYPKIKGEAEKELQLKRLNLLTIFRPGLLRHRRHPRMVEKFFSYVPIVPGIEAKDAAKVMKYVAEKYHEQALKSKEAVQIFENKDMLKMFLSV